VDEEDDILVERSLSRLMLRRTLREFVGIPPEDRTAIEAMVNFSYYLSVEQMDNAFKAIKFIKK
jgi:intraflagellar transport protein 140